jgi:hypothetical protein
LIQRRLRRSVSRILGPGHGPGVPADQGLPHRLDELPELVGGPRIRHEPGLDRAPSVVVLMPHLTVARMTGGPNTVFQITERLAARGLAVRYVACFGPMDAETTGLRRHLAQLTGIVGPTSSEFIDRSGADAELAIGAGDVVLATWWPTAHVALRALAVAPIDEFIYLIQDFEPGFHPWSTKYALAAATYQMPFRAIVNEQTLLEHLREQAHLKFDIRDPAFAISFMPSVDRALFRAGERPPGRRRLVFYARPKHPRNLFELGLRALATAVHQGAFEADDWTFAAIGEETRAWTLSARKVLAPVPVMTYRDYAEYLGQSDILLSLMLSPHTSYPPLEMAATGGLVITNTFSTKTTPALAAISPSIRGVPPDLDSLSAGIAQAARDRASAGRTVESLTLPGSWTESLADVVPWLEATIAAARGRARS